MIFINRSIQFFRILIFSVLLTGFAQAQSVTPLTTKKTNQIKTTAQLEQHWNKLWREKVNGYAERDNPGFLKADKKTQNDILGKMNIDSVKLDVLIELLNQSTENVIDESVKRFSFEKDEINRIWNYEDYLLMALVVYYRNLSDDESLVYLMSRKCPVQIGGNPVELYLAIGSIDRVSLLFDIYENSTGRNQVRVLKILKDVFADQCDECRKTVIRRMDAEFIKVSREWFEANKNQLTFNTWYKRMASYGSDQYGLFRPKKK
jgi:hypothetical protein